MKIVTLEISDIIYNDATAQCAKYRITVEEKFIKLLKEYANEYIEGLAKENLGDEVLRLKRERGLIEIAQ